MLTTVYFHLQDNEEKAVSRLKHYIALCGVRPNYKKLFEGCHSVKAKVALLKNQLKELGVEGQQSLTCLQIYFSLFTFVECNEYV